MWECHKYLLDQRHHITYKILSNLSITLKRPARLRLRTLWRYTNAVVIVIIIINYFIQFRQNSQSVAERQHRSVKT